MTAIPAVVIGGWLGAGKTTLVNHLLRHAVGRRIAVLVNDFGEISIDADLIVGAADEVLALAGGCVCCSFGADLVGTLMQVARRDPRPDIVLVECSGVGLPAAVARSAALAPGVKVDGIAVVVDAAELLRLARDAYVGDTVRQQVAQADLLIVNQADRAGAALLHSASRWLGEAAAGVPQAVCSHADVPADLVLGLAAGAHPPRGLPLPGADARFRRFVRRVDGPVDPLALAAELAAPAAAILRAKGVVLGLDGRPWLLQVMGRRSSVEPAPAGGAPGMVACIAAAG